jgi:hypothetical protein
MLKLDEAAAALLFELIASSSMALIALLEDFKT